MTSRCSRQVAMRVRCAAPRLCDAGDVGSRAKFSCVRCMLRNQRFIADRRNYCIGLRLQACLFIAGLEKGQFILVQVLLRIENVLRVGPEKGVADSGLVVSFRWKADSYRNEETLTQISKNLQAVIHKFKSQLVGKSGFITRQREFRENDHARTIVGCQFNGREM